MNRLRRIVERFREWYADSELQQRRAVEEDARRLGGVVRWSDDPTVQREAREFINRWTKGHG